MTARLNKSKAAINAAAAALGGSEHRGAVVTYLG
jgi:hypothetical protein